MRLLYKYMDQPKFLLEEGYIRASQLSALNDPFEATYCSNGLGELSYCFGGCDTGADLVSYIEEHKHRVGVICLTEAKDNLLMWAHYANEHKGFAVGIFSDARHTIFENLFDFVGTAFLYGSPYIFNGNCLPVIYRKQPRYRVDKFDFDYSNISAEGPDRILFEIFQQKSDEWIYEKEHRITLRLEQADKVIVHDIERLENSTLIQNLLSLDCYENERSKDGTKHTFHLNQISDAGTRSCYAKALASLSTNPDNLYPFKLRANSIFTIIKGISADIDSVRSALEFPTSKGGFDIWEAGLSEDTYTLTFEESS